MGLAQHDFTATELAEQVAADRAGEAYLLLRDGDGRQCIVPLREEQVTVGREPGAELLLTWDHEVSRVHARLERIGSSWTVVDDGFSRNGTFVAGTRVLGRRRLASGDILRVGRTEVRFRDPAAAPADTVPAAGAGEAVPLTAAQRRVLIALCRPALAGAPTATPLSNKEIADELHLSVEAVRTQLKALFLRLGVPDLPQNRKRAELVNRAVAIGLVDRRDL